MVIVWLAGIAVQRLRMPPPSPRWILGRQWEHQINLTSLNRYLEGFMLCHMLVLIPPPSNRFYSTLFLLSLVRLLELGVQFYVSWVHGSDARNDTITNLQAYRRRFVGYPKGSMGVSSEEAKLCLSSLTQKQDHDIEISTLILIMYCLFYPSCSICDNYPPK
jgi:hypothetical protein